MNARRNWTGLAAAALLAALLFLSATASAQQPPNGISEPETGQSIGGVVTIRGTATDGRFLRYEIAFLQEANPVGWISFAEGDQPVIDGILALWDTTVGRNVGAPVFPDGVYQLRLRVVRQDYNYDEYFVRQIVISNNEPTPTPTPEVTELPQIATLPPSDATAVPAVLPTLTPFPSPSPQPNPVSEIAAPINRDDAAENAPGLLGQLGAIDSSGFSDAFWRGATLVMYVFAALGGYLLLRGALRRLWRLMVGRLLR